MSKPSLPDSIRQVFHLSNTHIGRYQRDFLIFVNLTAITSISGVGFLIGAFLIPSSEWNDIAKIIMVFLGLAQFGASYLLYQETIKKKKFLEECQRILKSGISIRDLIKSTFSFKLF